MGDSFLVWEGHSERRVMKSALFTSSVLPSDMSCVSWGGSVLQRVIEFYRFTARWQYNKENSKLKCYSKVYAVIEMRQKVETRINKR